MPVLGVGVRWGMYSPANYIAQYMCVYVCVCVFFCVCFFSKEGTLLDFYSSKSVHVEQ